ncbi:TniQ family protein [Burkholderia seminalis]|uniref:TniQ family protein n=1 Tax=Burkholderia seminalis TaxID=488731 RepID=UPI003CD09DEA
MNFPYNNTHPYPFSDDIFPDEDGVGYALRMCDANALSFHLLAAALASPGHCYLPYKSTQALAFMFGGTPKLVARALVRRQFEDGITTADYLDQTFLRPKHLRQTCPQICPFCLHEDRRALASWSLTMMCCCTKHEICLVDRCACGRPISWRRRSLLVCECGREFYNSILSPHSALKGALAVCRQLEYLLCSANFRLHSPTDGALSIFDDVTPDVFVRLVWTMGSLDTRCAVCKPRSLSSFPTSLEVMRIADNAYREIQTLRTGRRDIRRSHWLPHLKSILDDTVTLAEHRLILSIVEKISSRPTSIRMPRRDAPVQLSLFEE